LIALSLLFLKAYLSITSTPSGISIFSIILSSNADSLICLSVSGNLTVVNTVFLNAHFQISVTFLPSIVDGISIAFSKH
jgi:hypothetical protein